jgi:hypothetical protein
MPSGTSTRQLRAALARKTGPMKPRLKTLKSSGDVNLRNITLAKFWQQQLVLWLDAVALLRK